VRPDEDTDNKHAYQARQFYSAKKRIGRQAGKDYESEAEGQEVSPQ
jgi:hypothetical protein